MPPSSPPDWLSLILAGFAWIWDDANFKKLATLATLIGGVIGLLLLFVRTRAADRQAKTAADRHVEQTTADRERRITESFAKAVEQLGSDKLETRLGAIYTLERISQESEREYWPIMETLTAFVRQRAPWSDRRPPVEQQPRRPGGIAPPEPQIRPETDIQAVLTVLGRRDEAGRNEDKEAGRRLDLELTDLRGANLSRAHLEGADFEEKAHLEEGADLFGAHLEGADLGEAHLENAILREAHLERTDLGGGYLDGADLVGAHLENAFLWGARLARATGLTQEQVNSAQCVEETKLPPPLSHPPPAPGVVQRRRRRPGRTTGRWQP